MCNISRNIAYLVTFLSLTVFLCFAIGTATPNWGKSSLNGENGWSGLISVCGSAGSNTASCETWSMGKCDSSPYVDANTPTDPQAKYATGPCGQFKSTQSLSALACILSSAALVFFLALLFSANMPMIVQIGAFWLLLGSGVCGMIAMSTYSDLAKNAINSTKDQGGTAGFDWSFGLMIVGWIGAYAGFAFGFLTGAAFGTGKISGSTS